MNTPNIKINNTDTFPNSYSSPGMESPNTMISPKSPMGSTDGDRVVEMPHGRTADDGQNRKPFSDMSGEKVPMMSDNDQEVDSDDLAPIVGGPVVEAENELAQSPNMDGKSNIPPGGRAQGNPVQTSKMSTSFENGRVYKGSAHNGTVIKGDTSQVEITTYE